MTELYDDSWKLIPCNLTLRGVRKDGYANVYIGKGKQELAHRWAWIQAYGPIPKESEICHKCNVRNCIEPLHLFLGTHDDNMQDAAEKGTMQNQFCIRGHEFTHENTSTYNGKKQCKKCKKIRQRKYRRNL